MLKNEGGLTINDHDILISLVVKVDDLKQDIKDLSDGTTQKIADHEIRIKSIETIHEKVNPEQALSELRIVTQWIHDFKLTWKTIIGVAVAMSSVITFILSVILQTTKLLGK